MLQTVAEQRRQVKQGAASQQASHSVAVVHGLKTKLMTTTQAFREALKDRTTTLKAKTQRKAMYGRVRDLGRPLVTRPPRANLSSTSKDQTNPSSDAHAHLASGTASGASSSTSRRPFENAFQQVALQVQEDGQAGSDSYLNSRADDVTAIESHINELGSIFQRLATMVSEQSHSVARLDDNVDQMLSNIELGQSQLERRYETVSDNRRLILKVFAVLLIFAVFFTVFVA